MENEAKTTCLECGQSLSYDKEHDGETVDCPTCSKPVTLTPRPSSKSLARRIARAVLMLFLALAILLALPVFAGIGMGLGWFDRPTAYKLCQAEVWLVGFIFVIFVGQSVWKRL
jgi:DNA-directed RNA polymerase subunit RPC12/RpoP